MAGGLVGCPPMGSRAYARHDRVPEGEGRARHSESKDSCPAVGSDPPQKDETSAQNAEQDHLDGDQREARFRRSETDQDSDCQVSGGYTEQDCSELPIGAADTCSRACGFPESGQSLLPGGGSVHTCHCSLDFPFWQVGLTRTSTRRRVGRHLSDQGCGWILSAAVAATRAVLGVTIHLRCCIASLTCATTAIRFLNAV
jgi:hypothetical protein